MATYVNGIKLDGDDDNDNTFVINTNGGNYNRIIKGDFVQGDVTKANGKIHKSAPDKPEQPVRIECESSINV